MNDETEKLLKEIQVAVQCQYLSDLHATRKLCEAKAREFIMEIPDDRYSAVAWSGAVSYITRKTETYATIPDAKRAIVNR